MKQMLIINVWWSVALYAGMGFSHNAIGPPHLTDLQLFDFLDICQYLEGKHQ